MNLNTKIIINNNDKGYLEGTFRQFCDNRPRFSQIGWRGKLPEAYNRDTDLWDLIIEKVIRPECFSSYEGNFKCYSVDNYSYKIDNLSGYDCSLENGVLELSKPVELITNRLRVLVEEE